MFCPRAARAAAFAILLGWAQPAFAAGGHHAVDDAAIVAERFRESRTNFWRAGARWTFAPTLNADLSHARSLDGTVPGWWTLGVTWAFDR